MRPSATLLLLLLALSATLLHPSYAATSPSGSLHTTAKIGLIPSTTAGPDAAIKHFCSRTNFFSLCVKSIKEATPRLKVVNNNTIVASLMSAIDAKTREAKSHALQLIQRSAGPRGAKTRQLLGACVETFDTALGNLATARAVMKGNRDDGKFVAMLNSVAGGYALCDDVFIEFYLDPPMAEWVETLQNMSDNCLAIVNLSHPQ